MGVFSLFFLSLSDFLYQRKEGVVVVMSLQCYQVYLFI